MSDQIRRKLYGDLKQFARAEMARDLAKRHGRDLRLPWDADDAPAAEPEAGQLDAEALEALSGVISGGD